MSPTTKPAVVLAHGAWHQGLHWSPITERLRAAGHEVLTPTMPSVSGTAYPDALHEDSAHLKSHIGTLTNAGKDVILVMHSYAGAYGSEAVAEFHLDPANSNPQDTSKGRILHLFYISAMILPQGTSNAEDNNTPHVLSLEDGLLHHMEPFHRFYEHVPIPIARHCMANLRPQALSAFTTKPKYRGWADHGIPVTYLACKQDRALEYEPDLVKFAGRIRDAGVERYEFVEMDTDHTPWLSSEAEFMDVLGKVLSKADAEAGKEKGVAKI